MRPGHRAYPFPTCGAPDHVIPRAVGDDGANIGGGGHPSGRHLARHAADPSATGVAYDCTGDEVFVVESLDQACPGVSPRVRREHAISVGEQQQEVGTQQDRDLGRQHVVVAEADLIGARGVVLVDHGHHVPAEQTTKGGAGVDVALPAREVGARQEYLRGGKTALAKQALPGAEEAALAHGGGRLQGLDASRALPHAQSALAAGDSAAADQHDSVSRSDELADLSHPDTQQAESQAPTGVGNRARAELHDYRPHGRHRRGSRLTGTRTPAHRSRPGRRAAPRTCARPYSHPPSP